MLTAADARQIMRSVVYPVMQGYTTTYLIYLAEQYIFEAARDGEDYIYLNYHPTSKMAELMRNEVKTALQEAGYVVDVISDGQMKVSFLQTIEIHNDMVGMLL